MTSSTAEPALSESPTSLPQSSSTPSAQHPLFERAAALLVRHEQLLAAHQQLQAQWHAQRSQCEALEHENRLLHSRLKAARARVEALINQLPANQHAASTHDPSIEL